MRARSMVWASAAGMFLSMTMAGHAADAALVAAAKKEGSVTWYTTLIVNQMARPAVAAFEKKYGIKVSYIRADTGDMLLRLQNEAGAGQVQADLIDTTSGTPLLKRMGILDRWQPDSARRLPPDDIDSDGYWTAASVYVLTFGYNTDLVPKGAEPTSLQGLLDPRWKGRLAISASSSAPGVGGFVGHVLTLMGETKGIDYLKQLHGQGLSILQVSTRQVLDQVIAGEYAINVQTLNHHAAFSANRGAPVSWVKTDPAMASLLVLGILKGPHPNAGRLLADFLVSDEGQAIFRDADYTPVAPGVPPKDPSLRPDGVTFKAVTYSPEKLDENLKHWMQVFAETLR
jgi:ABC-type Fe3+ transport system substrate-binding protein